MMTSTYNSLIPPMPCLLKAMSVLYIKSNNNTSNITPNDRGNAIIKEIDNLIPCIFTAKSNNYGYEKDCFCYCQHYHYSIFFHQSPIKQYA